MNQNLPQHLAIVMDGNGRWAAERGLARIEGHRMGINTVRMVVKECLRYRIPMVSLFAFSSENWLRPADEVDYLMQLFMQTIEQDMNELHQQAVSVRFIGERTALSEELQAGMCSIEALTANNVSLILNIMMNYGGRWDIVQAAKRLASEVQAGLLQPEAIDEWLFAKKLTTQALPDPDLLIRTSGELRISNFFLWQLAYSELYFSTFYWPDFNATELKQALDSYCARSRRYGTVSDSAPAVQHV